jgi:hypothetical protein
MPDPLIVIAEARHERHTVPDETCPACDHDRGYSDGFGEWLADFRAILRGTIGPDWQDFAADIPDDRA